MVCSSNLLDYFVFPFFENFFAMELTFKVIQYVAAIWLGNCGYHTLGKFGVYDVCGDDYRDLFHRGVGWLPYIVTGLHSRYHLSLHLKFHFCFRCWRMVLARFLCKPTTWANINYGNLLCWAFGWIRMLPGTVRIVGVLSKEAFGGISILLWAFRRVGILS